MEFQLAGFDFGKIENVVDDLQQSIGGRLDGCKIPFLFGRGIGGHG